MLEFIPAHNSIMHSVTEFEFNLVFNIKLMSVLHPFVEVIVYLGNIIRKTVSISPTAHLIVAETKKD